MGEGTRAGIFTLVEKKLVDRVLHLDDIRIDSLMVPRAKIRFFDINKLYYDLPKHLENYQHSRLVICNETLTNLIGVIHVKDFLRFHLDESKTDIKSYLKKPLLLPEDTPVIQVLEQFRKSPMHLAMVVDLHNSIVGLVTLNDVLEAIVGDIQKKNPVVVER